MDIQDVPANSEVQFEILIDLSDISPGTFYLYFDINNTGFDSVEDYSIQQIKVRSPPAEETTDWIGWLLGAMLIIALLTLTRRGGSRRKLSPILNCILYTNGHTLGRVIVFLLWII